MKQLLPPIAIILTIATGAAAIGHLDYEAELLQHRQRQEMEAIWCADAAREMAPSERAGWPPEIGGCA